MVKALSTAVPRRSWPRGGPRGVCFIKEGRQLGSTARVSVPSGHLARGRILL